MPTYPDKLPADLKRGLKPLYLIAGEEPLLIEEALDQIRSTARAQDYSEREVLNFERGFDWNRLHEASQGASLFASRRIIELNLGDSSPGVEGGKAIRELADAPNSDNLVLIRAARLDARARNSAWVKAVEKVGSFVYVWPMKPGELPRWLHQRLSAAGLRAEEDAIRLLVERTEGNLLAAAQDVEKLKLLCSGTLSVEDVREAVADSARYDVFDWTDRILGGDAAGAARGLMRLREEAVEPVLLTWALVQMLRQWADAAVLMQSTGDASGALRQLRLPRPRLAAFEKALYRARLEQVLVWLRRAGRIDALVKTGQGDRAWEELLSCALLASGAKPPRKRAA